MKIKRKIIKIDENLCDGCGLCVPSCAEGAIELINGKARLVAEKYCDGLGACLGECPNGALNIVEETADDFDEEAVVKHLDERKKTVDHHELKMACGCPSTQIQSFIPPVSSDTHGKNESVCNAASSLTHWPVQIRLVPPDASFLQGADLLVVSDCVPVAYAGFHDLLKGKKVLIGCPKFDDVEAYIQKFADIFNVAKIKSVTSACMEVPCCSALPILVKKGLDRSGKKIPLKEVVISTRGELLEG